MFLPHNVATPFVPSEFFIHKPSRIDFRSTRSSHTVVVDGTWDIRLDRRHPVAGQLSLGVDHELLKPLYMDGRYFVVDGQIVDHRDATHLTFMHDEKAIAKLAEVIGFVSRADRKTGHEIISAGNVTHNLEYEAFSSEGGLFDVEIGFNWSPFGVDIKSEVTLERMVCENLAVIRSPIMHHRIPMMNAWEENLQISNQVIGYSFHKLVGPRLKELVEERVSMYDIRMLLNVVEDLKASKHTNRDQYRGLTGIADQLAPLLTGQVERLQSNLLKFVPAPVTGFDAMNIATECATHYVAQDRTGTRALAFANNLIFDEKRQKNLRTDLQNLVVDTQTFRNADQAFFGETVH